MKGRYKCDSCGKTLVDLNVLKTHLKFVHEKQRDHKCNYCQKSFSKTDHLKNHIEAITMIIGPRTIIVNPVANRFILQQI